MAVTIDDFIRAWNDRAGAEHKRNDPNSLRLPDAARMLNRGGVYHRTFDDGLVLTLLPHPGGLFRSARLLLTLDSRKNDAYRRRQERACILAVAASNPALDADGADGRAPRVAAIRPGRTATRSALRPAVTRHGSVRDHVAGVRAGARRGDVLRNGSRAGAADDGGRVMAVDQMRDSDEVIALAVDLLCVAHSAGWKDSHKAVCDELDRIGDDQASPDAICGLTWVGLKMLEVFERMGNDPQTALRALLDYQKGRSDG